MSEIIEPEVKDLAWQLYEKISKLAKSVYAISEEDAAQAATPAVVKFGYIKDNLSDEEELSAAKQVVELVFTAIRNDLLETGHTHIFWRVAPTWMWSSKAAWDEVHLRVRYTLFTPKQKEEIDSAQPLEATNG